jgi:hypothetical protein
MASEEMAFTIPTIVARRAFPTVSEPTAREPRLAGTAGATDSSRLGRDSVPLVKQTFDTVDPYERPEGVI